VVDVVTIDAACFITLKMKAITTTPFSFDQFKNVQDRNISVTLLILHISLAFRRSGYSIEFAKFYSSSLCNTTSFSRENVPHLQLVNKCSIRGLCTLVAGAN
jgi:hypothetical protein